MKCIKGYEVKPQRSAAGYYLGTVDEEGFPACRLSYNYAKTEDEALELLMDRQSASENTFCNGCGSCFENRCVKLELEKFEYRGVVWTTRTSLVRALGLRNSDFNRRIKSCEKKAGEGEAAYRELIDRLLKDKTYEEYKNSL